jgi:hypothetical protein
MTTLAERFTFLLPDDWTPEQALAVYALLNELTDAIWRRYDLALLPLIDPEFNADTDLQPDLFAPDDPLPF